MSILTAFATSETLSVTQVVNWVSDVEIGSCSALKLFVTLLPETQKQRFSEGELS